MGDLFRKAVVETKGQRHFGDVVLASPISHLSIVAFLSISVTGLIVFSIFGEYAGKERVSGYIVPDKGLIRLIPWQAGVIEQINVKIGQSVEKGDRLFSIKTDTLSGYGLETAGTLLEQLEAEKLDLENRRAIIPRQYALRKERLESQILAAQEESRRLANRIALQQQAVESERDVLEKLKQLRSKGVVTDLDTSSQEIRHIEARQSLANLRNEYRTIIDRASDLQTENELLPLSRQQEMGDARSRLNSLQQRVTQIQSQQRYVVVAPVAGKIAALTAREGQLADTRRALATILPSGGMLDAELLVPSRAAGFVKEGQAVRLLYDAFPYQKFGFYSGTVTSVSRTVIAAADLPIATNTSEPVFVVTVALDRQGILADDQVYSLQSGMTLQAEIVLEKRMIWEWILEPLLPASKN